MFENTPKGMENIPALRAERLMYGKILLRTKKPHLELVLFLPFLCIQQMFFGLLKNLEILRGAQKKLNFAVCNAEHFSTCCCINLTLPLAFLAAV